MYAISTPFTRIICIGGKSNGRTTRASKAWSESMAKWVLGYSAPDSFSHQSSVRLSCCLRKHQSRTVLQNALYRYTLICNDTIELRIAASALICRGVFSVGRSLRPACSRSWEATSRARAATGRRDTVCCRMIFIITKMKPHLQMAELPRVLWNSTPSLSHEPMIPTLTLNLPFKPCPILSHAVLRPKVKWIHGWIRWLVCQIVIEVSCCTCRV